MPLGRSPRWGGRRQPRGEDERPGDVDEELHDLRARAHVSAVAAQSLAQRADDHVDLVLEPELGHGAASTRAEHAGGVSLVHEHAQTMALRELDDLGQWRHIAIHREHAVGDDHRAATLGALDPPAQVLDVTVLVDEHLRS